MPNRKTNGNTRESGLFASNGTARPPKTLQDAYDALVATGFGDYEARAYCSLLTNSPANGYQIARHSGIPRAKVYECLERLVARGAAVPIESSDKGQMFAPVDPKVLIDNYEAGALEACRTARKTLQRVQRDQRAVEVLWRVVSRDDLIDRGRKLARQTATTLHVAIWAEEFEALVDDLLGALDRQVRVALMLYSPHDGIARLQKRGAGAVLHSRTKFDAIPVMGKQFVVVGR